MCCCATSESVQANTGRERVESLVHSPRSDEYNVDGPVEDVADGAEETAAVDIPTLGSRNESTWSVGEMKSVLTHHGVDFALVTEKAELRRLVHELITEAAASPQHDEDVQMA